MCKVIAIANQKGGVAKSVTTAQLGAALSNRGKKVLIIDADSQGSITKNLGYRNVAEFEVTLSDIFSKLIREEDIELDKGILLHDEGMYMLPSTSELANTEISLATAMDRERILKEYIDLQREHFDYILFDCMPSLGVITRNVLSGADSVLIPVEADVSAADGIQELIKTIFQIRKRINSKLSIEGILFVNVENKTNYAKGMRELLSETYSVQIHFFEEAIPHTVKVAECAAAGISIFKYAPKTTAANAYEALAREVEAHEE